jgi:hypothetical protein
VAKKGWSEDADAARDLDEASQRLFDRLTSVELSAEERRRVAKPDRTAPEAERFLAVHWHPERAPLELVRQRLEAAFPRARDSLIIPTPHNQAAVFEPYAGVEADAYDQGYGLKIHLLFHFSADRLPRAGVFLDMMERTYRYRARQLLEILDLLAGPAVFDVPGLPSGEIALAARNMARFCAVRLRELVDRSGLIGTPRDELLKNRLLPDFMDALAGQDPCLSPALGVVRAAKKKVKAAFQPANFYSPREIIEEARALGAGVVIPHPPFFWPVLLDDLDVDGWEIWNSSSPRHAEFLARALARANEARGSRRRRLLAFMGDDTHLSSKYRPAPGGGKDGREIGFQDPWLEPDLSRLLAETGQSLAGTLTEYRARLG